MKEFSYGVSAETVLRSRFNKAILYQDIQKRRLRQVEPTHLPTPRINLKNTNTSEMFVLLVENLQKYKTEQQRATADKVLANALRTADYITDTLSGNDEAARFIFEAKQYLERSNPQLAEETERVMEAAYNRRDMRETRREDLYIRWRANQKSDLRQI